MERRSFWLSRFDGSTLPINDSLDDVRRWCGLSDGVNSRRNAEELTERYEHALKEEVMRYLVIMIDGLLGNIAIASVLSGSHREYLYQINVYRNE